MTEVCVCVCVCVCVFHQLIVFTGNYSSYSVANIMIRKSSSGCGDNTDYLDFVLPSHLVCPVDGIQCAYGAGKRRFLFWSANTGVSMCRSSWFRPQFSNKMLLFGRVLFPTLVQNTMQNTCVFLISSILFSKHFIRIQVGANHTVLPT